MDYKSKGMDWLVAEFEKTKKELTNKDELLLKTTKELSYFRNEAFEGRQTIDSLLKGPNSKPRNIFINESVKSLINRLINQNRILDAALKEKEDKNANILSLLMKIDNLEKKLQSANETIRLAELKESQSKYSDSRFKMVIEDLAATRMENFNLKAIQVNNRSAVEYLQSALEKFSEDISYVFLQVYKKYGDSFIKECNESVPEIAKFDDLFNPVRGDKTDGWGLKRTVEELKLKNQDLSNSVEQIKKEKEILNILIEELKNKISVKTEFIDAGIKLHEAIKYINDISPNFRGLLKEEARQKLDSSLRIFDHLMQKSQYVRPIHRTNTYPVFPNTTIRMQTCNTSQNSQSFFNSPLQNELVVCDGEREKPEYETSHRHSSDTSPISSSFSEKSSKPKTGRNSSPPMGIVCQYCDMRIANNLYEQHLLEKHS